MSAHAARFNLRVVESIEEHRARIGAVERGLAAKAEKSEQPARGKDGRGIESAHVDFYGDLIVSYTDGSKQNAGRVRGQDGETRVISIGGGGIGEARVLQLIEAAMGSDSGEQEHLHQPFTVTAAGPTTVLTPATGKALRLFWVTAQGDPDNADAPLIRVLLGARELYRAYAIAKRQLVTGAAGEALSIDLSAAQRVDGTVIYEEFTP